MLGGVSCKITMSRFSKEKESFLKTLTQFDGDTSEEDITGVCERKTGNSNTFIVHVLLESVLGLLEPDERKRQEMFIVACRYFYDLNLMDPEINLDNLIYPRRQMAFKFLNLFKKVQSELHPMPNNDHLLSIEYLNPSLCLETQKYRYEQNFEECEVIAKGGFGIVCKARHNTDGIIYAVKKIIFKYKTDVDYQKVFREVKSISTLNHANIVSYNNAWIEPFNASTSSTDSDESSSDSPNSKSNISSRCPKKSIRPKSVHSLNLPFNENLSSFSSSDSNGDSFSGNKKQVKFRTKDIISEEFSQKSFRFDSTCTDDIVEFQTSNHGSSSTYSFSSEQSQKLVWNIKCMNVKVMLCIQMEFCDCDLRLWLDQRAKGDVLPFRMEVKDIFKDILQGVAYIHSKSIIHRDLKPQNIFFSKKDCVMKIGDFGLSTLFCAANEIHQSSLGQFSSDLGTIPYAAPEQRKKHTYDSKVDIYSLGIILIELLLHFGTQMEFCKTIEKIAAGNLPDELISKWPNYINLVTNLIQTNPRLRLPAKEILKLPVLQENAEIDKKQLVSEIILLQEHMERKDKELKEKDILIKNLKLEIRNQALMISKLKETLINKAP